MSIENLRAAALLEIQRGATDRLSVLLKKVDDPRVLDVRCGEGDFPETLLEWSMRWSAVGCARILLESGADPMHSRRADEFCTVHYFACNARLMGEDTVRSFVTMLEAAGADFNAKDAEGFTPLHCAINHGATALAKVLIERGARVDPLLLDDVTMELRILPVKTSSVYEQACEALRLVRSLAMERNILSAMPTEPDAGATASPGMTL